MQLTIPYDAENAAHTNRFVFIRHFATLGNTEHRYIGRTDEDIVPVNGITESYPECRFLAVSPMKRCIQTARIIYPDSEIHIFDDLRECDFGDLEGKNYKELMEDRALAPLYQQWIDSGGKMRFPNGELPQDFRERSCRAFLDIVREHEDVTFIVHDGTIMSVLERFAVPQRDFYEYNIKNGGYVTAGGH